MGYSRIFLADKIDQLNVPNAKLYLFTYARDMTKSDPKRNVLIIALSGAGDVLMASPLIETLYESYPKTNLDILVQDGDLTLDLLQHHPRIRNILQFRFIKEGQFQFINANLIRTFREFYHLHQTGYDISINIYPQARYHYSVLAYLISAKLRIGFSYDSQTLNLNKLFFHRLVKENAGKHVVENNLLVLSELDIPIPTSPTLQFYAPSSSTQYANNYLSENNIGQFIVVHPGGGAMKNFYLKRWPPERFAAVVKHLAEQLNFQIIIVGGKHESSLKQLVINTSGLLRNKQIFDLSSNIQNTSAIIRESRLVIANDSLIAHIAASVGTYVITLFGPSDHRNTGPYTSNSSLICRRPSSIEVYKHGAKHMSLQQGDCMNLITTEDVLVETEKVLLNKNLGR